MKKRLAAAAERVAAAGAVNPEYGNEFHAVAEAVSENSVDIEETDAVPADVMLRVEGAGYSYVTDRVIGMCHLNGLTEASPFGSDGKPMPDGILDGSHFIPSPSCTCGATHIAGAVCPDCGTVAEEPPSDRRGAYIEMPEGVLCIENNIELIGDLIGFLDDTDEKTGMPVPGALAVDKVRGLMTGTWAVAASAVAKSDESEKGLEAVPVGSPEYRKGLDEGETYMTGADALTSLLSASSYEDAVLRLDRRIKTFRARYQTAASELEGYDGLMNRRRWCEINRRSQTESYLALSRALMENPADSRLLKEREKTERNLAEIRSALEGVTKELGELRRKARDAVTFGEMAEMLEERSCVLSSAHLHLVEPQELAGHLLYVLPPEFRPILGEVPGSDSRERDRLGRINNNLTDILALRNFMKTLSPASPRYAEAKREMAALLVENREAILDTFDGKNGFVRRSILGFKAEYSGRSVIMPDPELKVNEIGIPRELAFRMYGHKIRAEMESRAKETGDDFDFDEEIADRTELASGILADVVRREPWILYSRQPELCQDSLHIARAKIVDGEYDIRINPSVCPSMNADFDGDTIVLFPVEGEDIGRHEYAQNISHIDGKIHTAPFNESILGLYSATRGSEGGYEFGTPAVLVAMKRDEDTGMIVLKHAVPSSSYSLSDMAEGMKGGKRAYRKGKAMFRDLAGQEIAAPSNGVLYTDAESGRAWFVPETAPLETLKIPSTVTLRGDVRTGTLISGRLDDGGGMQSLSFDEAYTVDPSGGIHDGIGALVKAGRISVDRPVLLNGEVTHPGRLMLQSMVFDRMEGAGNAGLVQSPWFDPAVTDFLTLAQKAGTDTEAFLDMLATDAWGMFVEYLWKVYRDGLMTKEMASVFDGLDRAADAFNELPDGITEEMMPEYEETVRVLSEELRALLRTLHSERSVAIGRVLDHVASVVPPFTETLTKKSQSKYLTEYLDRYGDRDFSHFINAVSAVGYNLATDLGSGTLNGTSGVRRTEDLEKLYEEAGIADASDEVKQYYYQNTVLPSVRKFYEDYLARNPGNPFGDSIRSGQKGNILSMVAFEGHIGVTKDGEGRLSSPISGNLDGGLGMLDLAMLGPSDLRGLAKGAEMGQIGGYERGLRSLLSGYYIFEEDCGTDNRVVADRNGTEEERESWKALAGFSAASDVVAPDGRVLLRRGEGITVSDVRRFEEAGGTRVERRSPGLCESEVGICAKCFGNDLGTGNTVEVSLKVGALIAQAITAGVSQKSMDKHKSTGLEEGPDALAIIETLMDGTNISVINAKERSRTDGTADRPMAVFRAIEGELRTATGGEVNPKYTEALASALMSVRVRGREPGTPNALISLHEYLHLRKECPELSKRFTVEPVFHGARMGIVLQGELFRAMAQGGSRMSEALELATRTKEYRKKELNRIRREYGNGGRIA